MPDPLVPNTLDLPSIGLGCWSFAGGDYWGHQDVAQSVATVHAALDAGIHLFDSAENYTGDQDSEAVLGQALEGRRDEALIATKVAKPHLRKADVIAACEASLIRLRTDHIDLYQIHWPNPPEDIEEAWTEIQKAKEEGKIRWAGVSNHDPAQMRRLQAIAPVSSLQPPYSMLNRASEAEILPFCKDQGIGVVCYSPMECGLLTGKASKEWLATLDETDVRRRHHRSFKEPAFSASVAFVDAVLAPIAEAHGVQPAQVAVAWVLRHPAVTSAIVGARNPGQIEKTVRAAEVELSDADLEAIEDGLAARARKAG